MNGYYAQRERMMRERFEQDRLTRVKRAGEQIRGFLGPTLAVRTTDHKHLGSQRRDIAGLGGNQLDLTATTPQTRVAGPGGDVWATLDRAAALCESLELALIRQDPIAVAELVHEAIPLAKEMSEFQQQLGGDADKRADVASAFTAMMHHERTLHESRREIENEQLPSHLHGTVKQYAYSPAHDAIVCVVAHDGEQTLYPVKQFRDDAPEIGQRVTMHRIENTIVLDNYGHTDERSRSGERTRGAA